ncbi:MAG: tetratricopeptide repeat protein [Cyanobacteria bacterium P01_A01_bin.114]
MTSPIKNWYHRQTAKLAYRRGSNYAKQTNYQQSIDALTKALAKHPNPADIYVMRGLSYWKLGDTAAAIADFEAALALEPTHPKAHGNRGLLRYESGDESGALADWATALLHKPNYAEIYYNRALVYAQQGRSADALTDFDRALALQPNWAEAYFHRGNVRSHLGDQAGALNDWEIAACNDFSFEEVKEKLKALQDSDRKEGLAQPLKEILAERKLAAQIERVDDCCLKIVIHRQVGVGISYFTLPDLIRKTLIPLEIPGIARFQLVGTLTNPKNPGWSKQEWSKEYELYKDQPCPPSNWQFALSTLVTFPPIGATALIYAAQVKKFYRQGNYPEAVHASHVAKRLCVAGTGLICGLVMLPLGHTALASIRDEAAPPERTARTIDYSPEKPTHIQ